MTKSTNARRKLISIVVELETWQSRYGKLDDGDIVKDAIHDLHWMLHQLSDDKPRKEPSE